MGSNPPISQNGRRTLKSFGDSPGNKPQTYIHTDIVLYVYRSMYMNKYLSMLSADKAVRIYIYYIYYVIYILYIIYTIYNILRKICYII